MAPRDTSFTPPTAHLNVVAGYLKAHPSWVNDSIPACDNDGDQDSDAYTLDASAVTCGDCWSVIHAAEVDAGRLCPMCHQGDRIKHIRALGMPIFSCGCGCEFFDHLTMRTEDEAA